MSVKKKSKPVKPEAPSPQGLSPTSEAKPPREVGGRKQGLEPTRYGDWEKNGRCIDF